MIRPPLSSLGLILYLSRFYGLTLGKLVNSTIDDVDGTIIYRPAGVWNVESNVSEAFSETVSRTFAETEEASVNVSVSFVGSAVYIVGNDSSSCQAFQPAIDGKNVTDHLVLGAVTGLGSSGYVPYWGVTDLPPNVSHVLEITLYGEWFPTEQGLVRGNEPVAFYLDAIVFTHEVPDDSPTQSQPITTQASLTAADATTGTISPPSNSSTRPPTDLSSIAPIVGGALGGAAFMVTMVVVGAVFACRIRKKYRARNWPSYSFLPPPELDVWEEGNNVVAGEGTYAISMDEVARPFPAELYADASVVRHGKGDQFSIPTRMAAVLDTQDSFGARRSRDDISSVRLEVSELRAEMANLRQSTSLHVLPVIHGVKPDEDRTVPPPVYVP